MVAGQLPTLIAVNRVSLLAFVEAVASTRKTTQRQWRLATPSPPGGGIDQRAFKCAHERKEK
jgi:hypothetical protein